jgi:hypothetical protein
MLIISNWKLTFDPSGTPLVLLDYGDWLREELFPDMTKPAEVVNLAEASAPFIRDLGNRTFRVAFTVVEDAADDKTMRRTIMESLATVGPLARKVLKVQVNGITDRYWKFANAFVTEHTPKPVVTSAGARLEKRYSITATDFSQVGP